ncbi:MAG: response regulator [Chthoniobacterales bacterium]
MDEKIVLLVDADADSAGLVLEAGARIGHGVRLSRDKEEAFGVLSRELDHIDSIVVDVDPGSEGLVLLEAISALHQRPSIIALTSMEESQMEPHVTRRGAVACLGKPVSIERFCAALEQITRFDPDEDVTCDPWGHPGARQLHANGSNSGA